MLVIFPKLWLSVYLFVLCLVQVQSMKDCAKMDTLQREMQTYYSGEDKTVSLKDITVNSTGSLLTLTDKTMSSTVQRREVEQTFLKNVTLI